MACWCQLGDGSQISGEIKLGQGKPTIFKRDVRWVVHDKWIWGHCEQCDCNGHCIRYRAAPGVAALVAVQAAARMPRPGYSAGPGPGPRPGCPGAGCRGHRRDHKQCSATVLDLPLTGAQPGHGPGPCGPLRMQRPPGARRRPTRGQGALQGHRSNRPTPRPGRCPGSSDLHRPSIATAVCVRPCQAG